MQAAPIARFVAGYPVLGFDGFGSAAILGNVVDRLFPGSDED